MQSSLRGKTSRCTWVYLMQFYNFLDSTAKFLSKMQNGSNGKINLKRQIWTLPAKKEKQVINTGQGSLGPSPAQTCTKNCFLQQGITQAVKTLSPVPPAIFRDLSFPPSQTHAAVPFVKLDRNHKAWYDLEIHPVVISSDLQNQSNSSSSIPAPRIITSPVMFLIVLRQILQFNPIAAQIDRKTLKEPGFHSIKGSWGSC